MPLQCVPTVRAARSPEGQTLVMIADAIRKAQTERADLKSMRGKSKELITSGMSTQHALMPQEIAVFLE